jgi:hypothetical protein
MKKSVKKWTLTLPKELPLWELESWWISKFSANDYRGQNPFDQRFFLYHWKAIETYMSKMGSHDPFGHLKHKLWPKEGLGVKLPIWLPTTKSQDLIWFPYVQVACNISLESSRWGLQFCFRLHLNRRSAHKVIEPQSRRSHSCGNFETPTWESREKMSFGYGPRGEA